MKIKIFILLSILSVISYAQTTLSAGDIAILQYNSDGSPEVIKFLALAPMESGTTINFTDNGWRSDNTFRANEGTDTWTAPSNIKCGDIITFTLTNIALNANGDQILAYQGAASSPTFIFAINNEGSATWQPTANNSRTSALPAGLTNGTNAIALSEIDNAKYDSSTLSGTKSAILSAISTNANWGGSNTVNQTFTDTFTSDITWTTSWDGTGVTTDYFKAIIDGDYDTSTDGTFTACELEVNASRTLTVSSTVTIENSITNSGTILVEDNASVLQIIPDGPNTGTDYTVERVSTSQQEEGDYTYWSSPLTSATLGDVADAQLYYSFVASSQSWTLESSSSTMTPGIGYANTGDSGITYPGTYTASFSGSAFNNGDISVSLGFSSDGNADNDWNLIGNPYPSAIDADTFLNDNSAIGGTIYFWTHNTEDSAGDNTQDDYAMYNTSGGTAANSGGTVPDGNIASGQGFIAQSLSASNVNFTNSMRISGSNSTFFRQTSNNSSSEEKDRVWLNLTSSKNSFSQILIGFFNDATDEIDRKYDGLRFTGGNSTNFYSIVNEKHLGIQGKSSLKKKEVIPLGLSSSKSGDFTIAIDNLEGKLKESKIFLYDKLLDIKHRLDKSDYSFTISATGITDNRFELIIKSKVKKVKKRKKPKRKLSAFMKHNVLNIKSNTDDRIKKITVFNLYGRKIKEFYKNASYVSINLNAKEILILKIQLSNGEIITRKVINQLN